MPTKNDTDDMSTHFGSPIFLGLLLALCPACTSTPQSVDICDGVHCSTHGSCVTDGFAPYCGCEEGYHPKGLACMENDEHDPCLGVDCNDHGVCQVTDESLPTCICEAPFESIGSSTLCLNMSGTGTLIVTPDADLDSSETAPEDGDLDTDVRPCELGSTQQCSCDDLEGEQSCGDSGWGECLCQEPPCESADSRSCVCIDGMVSHQMCFDGHWLNCVCIEVDDCESGDRRECDCSDTARGTQECDFGEWDACICAEIGDLCTSIAECEGGAEELLCVLEHVGDTYGICTIPCLEWTVCTALDGDFSCCDIQNAGAACLPDDWECEWI